ncbi:hypothetical protein AO888_29165 [Pseudomonas aeruginosa]|nr:DUF5681 domain-containing protein [Pseudomonas aeruginosa]KSC63419.1 hypothetical protein AO888_29165 [Pseudomonas aeruginosa]
MTNIEPLQQPPSTASGSASTRFRKGVSGNPMGRPRKRPQGPSKPRTAAELDHLLKKLKPASGKAAQLMIDEMSNTQQTPAVRLKMAEKVFASYLAALRAQAALKAKADRLSQETSESQEPSEESTVVFTTSFRPHAAA